MHRKGAIFATLTLAPPPTLLFLTLTTTPIHHNTYSNHNPNSNSPQYEFKPKCQKFANLIQSLNPKSLQSIHNPDSLQLWVQTLNFPQHEDH